MGFVLGLLVLVLALAAGLWVWSGQPGSLATVLRLAGAHVPLVSDNAQGSVRRGGTVEKLVWDKDGMRVEVQGAELLWQPMALLHGQLQIDTLSARRIEITDQRAPSTAPAAGPPQQLSLPLAIEVKAISAHSFHWTGPPAIEASNFSGSYRYDHVRHALTVQQLDVLDGRYQGDIALGVVGPPSLKLAVQGAVAAPMPAGQTAMPVRAKMTADSPLTDMAITLDVAADAAALAELPEAVQAKLKAASAAQTPAVPDTGGASPSLQATARVTPWQAPLLPQLDANFKALDLGTFLPQAPRTRLSGTVQVQPLAPDAATADTAKATASAVSAASAATASEPQLKADARPAAKAPQHWRVQAHIDNAQAGPIDAHLLPLDSLAIDADWRDGLAIVRDLQAKLAGGSVHTTGQWQQPVASETPSDGSTPDLPQSNGTAAANTAKPLANLGQWALTTEFKAINPQAIHSQLDAFPLDGKLTAQGQGPQIDFKAKLTARAQRAATPRAAAAKAKSGALQALALQDVQAQGQWTGNALKVSELLVRALDAQLQGSAAYTPARQGGSAKLALSLPGLKADLGGELDEQSGKGQLSTQISDLARTQQWLKRLPGMPEAVTQAHAQGSALVALNWLGGWRNPKIDLKASSPDLRWQPPGQAPALRLSDLQLALQGGLDQAQLQLTGTGAQGEREAQIALRAEGGRSTPTRPLGESNWRLSVTQLGLDLRDPALGKGSWRAQLARAVRGEWQAASGKTPPALMVDAGQLLLTSPAPKHEAKIDWAPVRMANGQLSSAGRITGLPLAWAEQVAGDAMRQAGISGNVIFDASWDAQLGQQLKLQASVVRTQGDLVLTRKDPATDIETRIPAGLRDARLTLNNVGERLNLDVRWDSAQVGTATGQITTQLAATRDAQGHTQWTWPETAPLAGQVQLKLPRLGTWSVLAPPGWRINGSLQSELKIAGTRSAPLLTGTVQADDLAMRSVVDGLSFAGGRLRARLEGQRVLLDEFSLNGAGEKGGRLIAKGEAGVVGGTPSAQVTVVLQQLRASIRADRQMTVSGQLEAALTGKTTRVNGAINVDRALIQLPENSAPTLGADVVVRGAKGIAVTRTDAPLGASRDATQTAARAAAANSAPSSLLVQANIKLNLGEDFRLQGMGIDTKLKGELNLQADGPITTMPRLTGDVRTVGGTFKAYNQNLTIQRGLIRFTGPIDNPTLDIRALRPNYASEQRVGVQVQGSALLPAITLYANPALPETETLAWLLLGRAAPDTGAEAAMLQSAAMAVLGGKGGKSLASRFGLDELSFGTGSGAGSTSDASVTLGKRLSDNLYASYERSLSGVTGTLMIYLELTRRITLRGQAGEDSAVDLLFRLSFD